MLSLAIEATNPNVPTPGVLLAHVDDPVSGTGTVVLASRELRQEGRHDDLLLPAIAELFDEAAATPAQLDEVLVSIGPGGFTATRLACTAAAVLAEIAGATVLVVPTARVAIESQLLERPDNKDMAVAMAGKQDSVYFARFDVSRHAFSEPGKLVDPGEFDASLLPGDLLIHEGHLPAEMLEIASMRDSERIPLLLTAQGLLASRSTAKAVPTDGLRPIYPREPDAVTQWRRRYGKAPGDG